MSEEMATGPLCERLCAAPLPFDETRAGQAMGELLAAGDAGAVLKDLCERQSVHDLLNGVLGSSPYLAGLIQRDPARVSRMLRTPPETYIEDIQRALGEEVAGAATINEAMAALRQFKWQVALLTALCDLGGVWPVMQVTRCLSEAADAAVQQSVRFLFRQAIAKGDWLGEVGDAPEASSGYIVLAMGKHGAYELNYSSDIDLIVFYEPERARLREGVEIKTFFVRLTRDLVKLMQERTADGYVFRTDLRLRPDPAATQVALSTTAALIYYESFGQNWERAALIKARAIAGDFEAGAAILEDLAPFIWRKYLDFAAIADIHAMKRQIHAFKGFGKIAVAGHNIKLGRGGIREIEFFAQTQQLIAGGRQNDLRIPATLDALQQLTKRGWIEEAVRADLETAYKFLRRIEHRLQMLNDEQTQTLPADDEALRQMAMFSGYADAKAFGRALRAQLELVQQHYGALFEADPGLTRGDTNMVFAGADDDPGTLMTLGAMGFRKPAEVIASVRGWHRGRYAAVRSPAARERLTEMQPLLIEALSKTADPDRAVIGFDEFLSRLPTGIQLFALLKANPSLMRLVADIVGSAPRLARILSRRRRVLDAVLDPGFFGSLPSREVLEDLVSADLAEADDLQEILDQARVIGNEQAFLIGVRVLSGTIGAGRSGGAYAQLAEVIIAGLQRAVEQELMRSHGAVTGGAAAVIAMGKLGGNEMTAASDLDLIVIYDYDRGVPESDGKRPLSPNQYYARLTQRLISSLSAPTAEGMLYEVDMRLRPSGQKGPVATQLSSFIDYQTSQAWTWEHLALTRARVITGPPDLRDAVERAIRNVLTRPREREKIAADVRDMRARIAAEKGTSDIWNLKQVRGGQVDLEFIVQYLQLIHAAGHPDILSTNTYHALKLLAQEGIITPAAADKLVPAANLYNNLTQVLRLCLDGTFSPQSAPEGLINLLCRAGEMPDFQRLTATLETTLADVAALFDELVV